MTVWKFSSRYRISSRCLKMGNRDRCAERERGGVGGWVGE
jgi:hypothetical protein